ncbi:MAG: hypothetical protein ACI9QV_000179 [Methylophagaceae bacterium]|jgi:Tfp pilus assembly protein PilZ
MECTDVIDDVHSEKRSFVRMHVDTLVTFNIKGKTDGTYHGTSQNLSATGLYLITEDAVKLGDEVELIMNSSNQKLPPFVAEGTVMRCNVDEQNSSLFHVSISLTKTH